MYAYAHTYIEHIVKLAKNECEKKLLLRYLFLTSLKVFMAAPLQSTMGLNRPELNKNLSKAFSSQLKSKTIKKSIFVRNKCYKRLVV